DLGRWLRLGKGEEKNGGREKPSILAAVYEALLGAIYLDAGYERARSVVEAHFAADVLEHPTVGLRDYKTELQELTQRLFRETPARRRAAMTPAGRAPADLRLEHVTVFLGLRHRRALDALIAAQQDRRSPLFHRWLAASEIADRFGPRRGEYERVRRWFVAHG